MSISVSDPLELLPYLTGVQTTPLEERGARGSQQLDVRQRAIVIGDPIPIIFCRRVNNNGGVFYSPGATEGRFESNSTNVLTASYQLILSEGDLPQLLQKDLYQAACAVGTWVQTYNRRAGTWLPGRFLYDHGANPNNYEIQSVPEYCGTSGYYNNLSTLSFTNTYQNGDDRWDRQVHVFIRNGIEITRILDNTLGSSNNIIDLVLYLIRQTSRFPETLIDTTAMTLAANFTNTNSFFYNGVFEQSSNLEDWIQEIAPKFLLRVIDKNGKKGFRPLLPTNNDYTIKTTAVSWVFGFTEEHILPDGFEIDYISLSDRKPICALMMWRQQPDNDIGIIRTTEVRFTGEATNGPFEQYDLSEFCTVENHAVKVGAYYVARRKYITHSLRIRVRPDAFNSTLLLGDIVRVKLRRETNANSVTFHDYLYEVERIRKDISGVVELDLMHFPTDNQNRSLVALSVAQATGAGYSLPSGRADFTCNVNTSSDPIADQGGNLPGLPAETNFKSDVTDFGTDSVTGGGVTGEGGIVGEIDNPVDIGIAAPENLGDAMDGDTVSVTPSCPNAKVYWYRIPKNSSTWDASTGTIKDYSQKELVEIKDTSTGPGSLVLTSENIDYIMYAEYRCQDPSQPDGYGTPVAAGYTNPVEPDFSKYSYARYIGTTTKTSTGSPQVINTTSCWIAITSGDYLTIGGAGNFSSGVRFEDNGLFRASAIGPVPWRSSVFVQQYTYGPSTQVFLGTLGKNENGSVFAPTLCVGIPLALPGDTVSALSAATGQYASITISGRWEFSTNGTTVAVSWEGRD
jgi:hypothetical protein